MDITVRKATLEDIPGIARLMAASWRAAFSNIITPEEMERYTDEQRRQGQLRAILQGGEHDLYVALYGDIPCGEAICAETRDEDSQGSAEVISIYADPEYWGKGVGRAVMRAALAGFAAQGYSDVLLWVFKENERARTFYERCGFEPDGAEKSSPFSDAAIEMRYRRRLD